MFFIMLCRQSICYTPQCFDVTFGKCSPKKYCGISDTDAYICLPCPAGNLCPGDGHTYIAPQLKSRYLKNTTNKYIVSSGNANRVLFRKKLKRIGKIVKVGLTIAAIAKTGGVAALKKAAAAKAKELAIKKGLQCLKNGLSNFCNGAKRIIKKGATIKKGGLTKKIKPSIINNAGSKKKIPLRTINTRQTGKTTLGKSKVTKRGNTKPVTKKQVGKVKKPTSKGKKPLVKGKPPVVKSKPCSNIFDNIANKVNNVTHHIAKKAVNKGRDWLKRNVGGDTSGCIKGKTINVKWRPTINKVKNVIKRKPTNLRGSGKGSTTTPGSNDDTGNKPVSDDSNNNVNSPAPTASVPITNPVKTPKTVKRRPVIKTDDSIMNPTLRPTRPIKRKPVIKSDDSIVNPTLRPTRPITHIRRPVIKSDDSIVNPTTIPTSIRPVIKTDDSVANPTLRPIRRRSATRIPITRPTRVPVNRPTIIPVTRPTRRPKTKPTRRPKTIPTRVPVTIPNRRPKTRPTQTPTILLTNIPTRIPSSRPSRNPTVRPTALPTRSPTVRPTALPTRAPTVRPTALPSRAPTLIPSLTPISTPTMIPLTWAIFSNAPVKQTNIPPTVFPTISMFSITTNTPTTKTVSSTVSSPTISPTLLNTFSPTISTLRPTTIPPTVLPTNLPITSPTQIPTFSPTAILTNSPTQSSGGSSSSLNSGSVRNQQSTPTTIGAVVGCIVVLLILVGICAFIINRRSKTTTLTPFEKWTTHYSSKGPQLKQNVVDDDIHHFYNKSPRPSFNPNPTFTPHLSTRQSQRYSQTTPKRNSNRMTYRNAETSFNL